MPPRMKSAKRRQDGSFNNISAHVFKKQSDHTDGRIRACKKYELPALTMLALAKENATCPEMYEQNGGLNAATAGGFR